MTLRRPIARILLAAALAALPPAAGCARKVSLPSAPDPVPPAAERTLSGDVQPIFTARCAVPSCHAGPAPVLDEDLSSPALSYSTTVNVPSREVPSKMRVVPGDPAASYTLSKVRGDAGIVGGRMPLGGPYLSAEEVQAIEDWIRAGAKRN
ncbi:MAG: hypothetical protein HZB25_13405 [Candidatus Eisenbacteria bacterium]|nr:hypothetical protein [Candidatus Eisenbacteria bacterium]